MGDDVGQRLACRVQAAREALERFEEDDGVVHVVAVVEIDVVGDAEDALRGACAKEYRREIALGFGVIRRRNRHVVACEVLPGQADDEVHQRRGVAGKFGSHIGPGEGRQRAVVDARHANIFAARKLQHDALADERGHRHTGLELQRAAKEPGGVEKARRGDGQEITVAVMTDRAVKGRIEVVGFDIDVVVPKDAIAVGVEQRRHGIEAAVSRRDTQALDTIAQRQRTQIIHFDVIAGPNRALNAQEIGVIEADFRGSRKAVRRAGARRLAGGSILVLVAVAVRAPVRSRTANRRANRQQDHHRKQSVHHFTILLQWAVIRGSQSSPLT